MQNPVLLLHGIDDSAALFHVMAPYLRAQGRTVYSLDMVPNNGAEPLEKLAAQVEEYVQRTLPPDFSFDLVGFSMGGIVGRYYLQRLGGLQRVQRFITLSSPHNGTVAAYARPNPGGRQMRPNSAFLRDLNRDLWMLEQINFTSIWTPLDLVIVPANSSQLPVGRDVQVWVGGHAWMVTDPRSLALVDEALREPLRQPARAGR